MKRFTVTCLICGASKKTKNHLEPWRCPADDTHLVRVKEI